MALGDFRKLLNEAVKEQEEISYSSLEEIKKAFSDVLNDVIVNVYFEGQRGASRADGIDDTLPKNINLSQFTVVEFTAAANTAEFIGTRQGRYRMSVIKNALLNPKFKPHEKMDQYKEDLGINAIEITTAPIQIGEDLYYPLTLKKTKVTLYASAPWYLRGHGIVASKRATETPVQEAGQALGICIEYLTNIDLDNQNTKIDINQKEIADKFKFRVYENNESKEHLQDWFNRNRFGAVLKCANGAKEIFNEVPTNNKIITDISKYSSNFGSEYYNAFYKIKSSNRPTNINSWCPADIVVCNGNLRIPEKGFNTLSEYTEWLNKRTEEKKLRLISLKLNKTFATDNVSYTHISDEHTRPTIKNLKWEINSGDIFIYVNLTENRQNNIIRLRFSLFNNDSNASIEADYHNGKSVLFPKISKDTDDIEVSNYNKKANTHTVLGKACDTLKFFLNNNARYQKAKDVNFVWPEGFEELLKTDILQDFVSDAETPIKSKTDFRLLVRPQTLKLYKSWLENMRKYCLTHGRNDGSKNAIYDYILYTIYAGKKENFGEMNFFPKYYKIA